MANLNRRSFLFGATATITSAFALDPERLLWVPGKKVISIPNVELVERPKGNAWFYIWYPPSHGQNYYEAINRECMEKLGRPAYDYLL